MGSQSQNALAEPLFAWIEAEKGRAKHVQDKLNLTSARLSNWRTRGIPARELPRVAAIIGKTTEEYLQAAGRPVPQLAQPQPAYLTYEEQQLLADYRKAHPRWQLTLRLLAKLPSNGEQREAAESMNAVLAKIAATPVPDEKLGSAWVRPDKSR